MTLAATPMPAPLDELDELSLRRAQRGEDAACRALVERYQARVFALLSRMLGRDRRALIEDLAQETFLQVFRALAGYSPLGPARLSTWILTIATRRAIDELRRRPPPISITDEDAPSTERADERLVRAELGAALERALVTLPPDFRAAFLLREYHGLELAEVARALGVEVGTVKSRLSRARAALRVALAEVHPGAEA